jgi:hypothetical protein
LFSSLTPAAEQFLKGHIPKDWYKNDRLFKEFLMSFMIPQHIRDRPPIKSTLTSDDIVQGISKWQEKTTTSPSGRHLGHYKALIQEPASSSEMPYAIYACSNKIRFFHQPVDPSRPM